MKSLVTCDKSTIGTHFTLQKEFVNTLDTVPHFEFGIYNLLDDAADDAIISYPDFNAADPLFGGDTIFVIKNLCPDALVSRTLVDPTWKDTLNVLNNLIANNVTTKPFINGFEIIGLSESGMGYIVEVLWS